MTDFKYPRTEKLKQKKEIDFLFAKGKWTSSGSLRVISVNAAGFPHQINQQKPKVGVSVSKRYFKKAVDRNRVKRQLREVYRTNKEIFGKRFGVQSFSMIFWASDKKPESFEKLREEFLNLCKPKEKQKN